MPSRKTRFTVGAHFDAGSSLEDFDTDEVRRLFVLRALVRHGRVHEGEAGEPIRGNTPGSGSGSGEENRRSLHESAGLGRGVAHSSTRRGHRSAWIADQRSVLVGLLLLVLGGAFLSLSLSALLSSGSSWSPSMPPAIVGVSPQVVPVAAPSRPNSPSNNNSGPRQKGAPATDAPMAALLGWALGGLALASLGVAAVLMHHTGRVPKALALGGVSGSARQAPGHSSER